MNGEIGESAGVVWNYLDQHENVSVAGLAKGTGLKQRQVDRAIGWLAREGKVSVEKAANRELVSLVTEGVPV
jgi:hypothetical protein